MMKARIRQRQESNQVEKMIDVDIDAKADLFAPAQRIRFLQSVMVMLGLTTVQFAFAQPVDPVERPNETGSPSNLSAASVSSAQITPVAVESVSQWAVYGQYTNVYQWHPAFNSPYSGTNSLTATNNGEQTNDATLYLGYQLSPTTEFWINPEYDQGFGLNDTLGVAGFPSGEAYKVGANNPYYRTPRLFMRKVFNLGGAVQSIEADANQMAETRSADNLVLTVGKFAVTDVFDTNSYAHDPRADFLNWSVIDAGAFDYAADSWGYSYGASAEWTQSWWTWRSGVFDLSTVPNGEKLSENMSEFELVTEFEERHQWHSFPGKVKVLVFANHAPMGSYGQAVLLGQQTGCVPDTALVRQMSWRPGVELNMEQGLSESLGIFGRASMNDGAQEAYEFTDINQSISAGFSLQGKSWGREQDTVGMAYVLNGISRAAQSYFAAGGLGVLVGDGQLPHYGYENITEMFYAWQIQPRVALSLDYQYIANPAYNADRGPVNVFGVRTHLNF
jgi:high affinity Mn2+ porin